MYSYEFDRKKCLYLDVCGKANTPECSHSCIRYMEMDFLIKNSNLTPHQTKQKVLYAKKADYNAFSELTTIKNEIEDFVINGKSLYLGSDNFGNGKTSWAIKLLLTYFDRIWSGNCFKVRGLFIHVPSFMIDLKSSYFTKDEHFETLKRLIPKVDLVVWDDIGATKLSDADHTLLLSLVDKRINNGKSNIYTGNISPNELTEYLGGRLASRILNQSQIIELQGGDRR